MLHVHTKEYSDTDHDKYLVHYRKGPYIIIAVVSAAICLGLFLMLREDIEYDLTITHSYERLFFLLGSCGFFLLINLLFIALGIFTKEYMLKIDDRGITNNMAGAYWKFIPWEDIADFELFSTAGQMILGIKVIDERKYVESLGKFRKRVAKSNKFFSDSLIQVGLELAKEDPGEIVQAIMDRWPESLKESAYERIIQEGVPEQEEIAMMGDLSEISSAWKISAIMIAIHVVIYIADMFVSSNDLSNYAFGTGQSMLDMLLMGSDYDLGIWMFGNITELVMAGQVYRLLTHSLFHADLMHLLCNMFVLFSITIWHFTRYGKREYFTWYLAGSLGGGLGTLALALASGQGRIAVGASAAIFGLMGGAIAPMIYSVFYANEVGAKLSKFDRREMLDYATYILVMLIPGFFYKDVSWEGHLGGLIGGIIAGTVMLVIKNRKHVKHS